MLFFISACSQKENELEDEDVRFYEKEFQHKSEHWVVKLHLIELPVDRLFMEESTFSIKYLKEFDEIMSFNYKMIYGDPVKYTVMPFEKTILTRDQDVFKVKKDQQRLIEEVCFNQFTLKILWNDDGGKQQEESFVFKDNQNPLCEHVKPRVYSDY